MCVCVHVCMLGVCMCEYECVCVFVCERERELYRESNRILIPKDKESSFSNIN